MERGTQVSLALWGMTGLALILVALRIYIRIRIVRFFVLEDYLYLSTFVWLLAFAASIQVAIHHGVGREVSLLTADEVANAVFWTYVGSSIIVTGNAFAKLSMGFFLLRVVPHQKQKILLWILVFITAATSFILVVMIWNQADPVQASWDVYRTPGVWKLDLIPLSAGLGAWSSACDFFFAAFPWVFIWKLQVSLREKILVAGGMSLGVIAGACGIVRTIVLTKSNKEDYTMGFSRYYIWAGAEVAVALVCLAIPTLRPLYQKIWSRKTGGYERTEGHEPRQARRGAADPESFQLSVQDTYKSAVVVEPPPRGEIRIQPPEQQQQGLGIRSPDAPAAFRPSTSDTQAVEELPPTALRPPPRPKNFSRVLPAER
ncbi:hypothetical protein VTJ83DRAFT_6956 [Remersonia thermophila]|uniref:Rhodopsin domain-containing protein n=1 Tax=Remersonia thermophila TaxID=72144 RepID=A0ABR4D665_9PEZI